MRACECCGESTSNPKYCGRSCAAKVNNAKTPKRSRKPRANLKCLSCGALLARRQYSYCSSTCNGDYLRARTLERLLSGYYIGAETVPSSIRSWLMEEQGWTCALCPQGVEWQGKPLVFVLDHEDGNYTNNIRDNLRMLCPNCDTQLPTYKSKNKGNGRHNRRMRYHSGKSY